MKINAPEKEGKDCGCTHEDQRPMPSANPHADENTAKLFPFHSGATDKANLDKAMQHNFDENLANRTTMDGLGATAWGAVLRHGVSVDNAQNPPNFKVSLKDS